MGNHQATAAFLVARLHRAAPRAVQYPFARVIVLVLLPELDNAVSG